MRTARVLTKVSSLPALLLASLLLSTTLLAQSENASISGSVKDSAGAAVAGAEVSLLHSQRVVRTALTGADGKFNLENVAPGSYAVVVKHSGFGQSSSALQLGPGDKKDLNVALEINSLSEEVTVTAEAGQVSNARALAQPLRYRYKF